MLKKKTRIYTNFKIKNIIHFFTSVLFKKKNFCLEVRKYLKSENINLTSQGRVALYDIVKLIISKTGKRNFFIAPYTLPEVIFAIRYAGGCVKYIDINVETGLINDEILFNNIDNDTAAVIITHLYSSKENINKFIEKFNNKILIIEDAAINFGAKINDRNLGTLGDFGFFSFNLVKNLNTLNGGAIYIKDTNTFNNYLTNRQVANFPVKDTLNLFLTVLIIKLFFNNFSYQLSHYILNFVYKNKIKLVLKKIYPVLFHKFHSEVPKNYSYDFNWLMNDIAINNLKDIDIDFETRIIKSKLYKKYLSDASVIKINFHSKENALLEYPIILKKIDNIHMHNILMEKGYDVRKIWYINNSKYEKNFDKNDFQETINLEKKIFCLPLHKNINEKDIKNISEIINNA